MNEDRQCRAGQIGGFTLVELLVVIGIMVLLLGASGVLVLGLFSQGALDAGGTRVVELLTLAQRKAVETKVQHLVVFDRHKNTVSIWSAGPDGLFAFGISSTAMEDDVLIDQRKLDDVSPRDPIWIVQALDAGRDEPLGTRPEDAEGEQAALLFTDRGIRFLKANLSGTRINGRPLLYLVVSEPPVSPTPLDAWEDGTGADIKIGLVRDYEELWIRVNPVTGHVQTRAAWNTQKEEGGGGGTGGGPDV